MASNDNLKKFNTIYDKTYSDILRYIIIKCHNINDANDIIQDVYLELFNILNRKEITDDNIKSFLIGIAINKIKKYYSLLGRIKRMCLFYRSDELDVIDSIRDEVDIEDIIIRNEDWEVIWKFIKDKKNKNIAKVFYLHYKLELSIKEIAEELNVKESYVKNLIYRTLKELCALFGKECDKYE